MKLLTLALLIQFNLYAAVDAMFHPYDSTFEAIASRIEKASERVDLALYNIDDKTNNPIIKKIASKEIQARLNSGELAIRMIFEGYEKKAMNMAKMERLEELGIDVRYLGSSKKMHHKFAVIDGGTSYGSTITGSANWSMMSRRSYSENILFFDGEAGISSQFQHEFNLLWGLSKEIGMAKNYAQNGETFTIEEGVNVHFNTNNFEVKRNRLYRSKEKGWHLTKKLVEAIDAAQFHIQIATTRIRLRPVYEALLNAAARGVNIEIVVTMGEYEYKNVRNKMSPTICADVYLKDCSTGENFAVFLSRDDFNGSENVDVRLKYFHVKKSAYLNKQMHSKYMIVDGTTLLTGSFNWSYSAEFNHIENLVVMENTFYPEIIGEFQNDFNHLYELRRDEFMPFIDKFEEAIRTKSKINCSFAPMTLSYQQIDYMLASGRRAGGSTTKACK
jgi:phosphatidylserine/phosphatidylglycerophosphate/cardiolipin synthase-like enzyme